MKRPLVEILICSLIASTAAAQAPSSSVSGLQTTPEKTDFRETSRYADVMAFVEAIDKASTKVHATTFGMTNENARCRSQSWEHRTHPRKG